MKFYLYVGLLLLLVIHWVSASDQAPVDTENALDRRYTVVKSLGNKFRAWWTTFIAINENQDTFTGKTHSHNLNCIYTRKKKQCIIILISGRCIGVAKKIKQLLPFLVFGMGAITTLLGFLTLFSLKTLGLLGLLLLINTSAAVAKITAAFSHKEDQKKQNIHLHIHNSKDG